MCPRLFVEQSRARVQMKCLDSLLLEHVQLSSLLDSVVGELLLQMQDLIADHDLHLVGGQVRHSLLVTSARSSLRRSSS